MGFYDDQVLPRLTDLALGRPMEGVRSRVVSGLKGDVLEVGFGSGRNLTHLPPEVTRLRAVEPSPGGRSIASKRIRASTVPVEFVGTDGQEIPLPDGSVDHVLVTWTLCTIPDVEQALSEMHRVVRPGGTLRFAEHGRSPDPKMAARQDRWNPQWGRLFGGCNINRSIDELVESAGFELTEVDSYALQKRSIAGYLYEGTATKHG